MVFKWCQHLMPHNKKMKAKITIKCFDCGKRYDITKNMSNLKKVKRYTTKKAIDIFICKGGCFT